MKLDFDTDQGIGTRANLGLVVLETDETLESEFARMTALPGLATYHTRIPMVAEIQPDTLARMERDLPDAVRLLPPSLDFDVIGYGCTSASAVIGSDKVAAAIQTIAPRAKVTDPLAAIIAATRALRVENIGFLTPYAPQVSARMRGRLEQAGLSIASFGSFEESHDPTVARITPDAIRRGAIAVAEQAPCDAIFIACTNLRCLDVIPEIEAETGIPVLSSNQAMGWHMLRLAGVNDQRPGFGRLFSAH